MAVEEGEIKKGRIQRFLDLYANKSSANTYRAGILAFLDFIYGKQRKGLRATKQEFERYEKLAEQYFTEGRDHYDDLMRFTVYLHENATPPLTAKQRLIAVRQWFMENDIEFTQKQLKRLRLKLPKGKAQTDELIITHDIIRKLLSHADIKMRALILLLGSSGMRINEALQIKIDDLHLNEDPPRIHIRGEYTKTGEKRVVFITGEAREALQEWLKVREQYLVSAFQRNRGLQKHGAGQKDLDDSRLFPFDVRVAESAWRRLLMKSGLLKTDEKTRVVKYRIHGLRKFFRTNLAAAGVPIDVIEALMGHSGYLTECYRRYTEQQIAEKYRQGEHLLVVGGPENLRKMEEKLKEQREELNQNRRLIEQVLIENKQLKDEIEVIKMAAGPIEVILDAFNSVIEELKGNLKALEAEIDTIKSEISALKVQRSQ